MISKLKLVEQNECHKGTSNNCRTQKELVGLFLYKGCANELKMFIKNPTSIWFTKGTSGAAVNMATNLQVPQMQEVSQMAEDLLVPQRPCSMS